ncbi:MAG: DUF21 domain-containing protein, partial [Opitutaceae bacterium]|nr:DUF21 domain-containing protein [Opitutaceae bacterium]
STTGADIAALKKSRPARGLCLERLKHNIEDTMSTILTLNTLANTLGSVIIGGLATRIYGDAALGAISAILTIAVLIFAEFLPKSIGVNCRRSLQPVLVYPLHTISRIMRPVSYLSSRLIRIFIPPARKQDDPDEEIILLAERGAQQGILTRNESNIITNTLGLSEVRVTDIMTPRTVVTALQKAATVGEVFSGHPNIPFGRMPVYGRNLDDVVGVVRRRDLLKAKAEDRDQATVQHLMQEVHFIPETVSIENALQVFLRKHQQFLVVVDEFGATAGVLTMEDVMEHILGREIFENDDVAVDMREFARSKNQRQARATLRRAVPPARPPIAPPSPKDHSQDQ